MCKNFRKDGTAVKTRQQESIVLCKDGDNVYIPNDTIPMGLRRCPWKWGKKRLAWYDQLCSKEQCALWDDERQCCGRKF